MALMPFFLALTVDDLAAARRFYTEVLACGEGRCGDDWVCFDFFDHQLLLRQAPRTAQQQTMLDADMPLKEIPDPHFGVFLQWDDWESLAEHLRSREVAFLVEPHVRHEGDAEQALMFLTDPSGNVLGFKALENLDALFSEKP